MQSASRNPLKLKGELSIRDGAKLARSLTQTIERDAEPTVDAEAATAVDTGALQILIAAHKSAQKQGKTLTIQFSEGSALDKALHLSGVANAADQSLVRVAGAWTGLTQSTERSEQ